MSVYEAQLEQALAAIKVHSDLTHSWLGDRSPALPAPLRRRLPNAAKRAYVVQTLQTRLYASFYAYGHPVRTPPLPPQRGNSGKFVQELSLANCGKGGWEGGWELRDIEGSQARIYRGGLLVSADLSACRGTEESDPRVGEAVEVKIGKELPAISPGFYLALGDAPGRYPGPVVRIYWNVNPRNAVVLMRMATLALNEAEVPFHLKILDHPMAYGRCDAAVLYVPRRHWERLAWAIKDVCQSLSLEQGVPAFTKRLAPGVGLAEDPETGDSFGLHRCLFLAEAVVEAESRPESAAAIACERLEASGINIRNPYLSSGSDDVYELP